MKKLFLMLSLAFFAMNIANAQKVSESNEVFDSVDKTPEFPGGIPAMFEFIGHTLKYPSPAKRAKVQGKVFVKMIVEKDGSINDAAIVKGIGFGCDEEVIRVVKAMPKWTPGQKDNAIVRTSFTLPVNFVLDNKKSK